MASSLSSTLNVFGALSESKRIINAHSRHFLALSVLFLLPLSFLITVYPTLLQTLSNPKPNRVQNIRFSPQQQKPSDSLTLSLIYISVILILSLCATGAISYSVFHGFFGRPVKLFSALKSILYSFIPLLVTVICFQGIVFAVLGVFGVFFWLLNKGFELLGFEIGYGDPLYVGLITFGVCILVMILIHLQVIWSLAGVVVVAESIWGFEPLRRSANLVKGMRRVSLNLLLFFGFFIAVLIWSTSASAVRIGGANGWSSWVFVVQIVVTSSLVTYLFLHNLAANTVMYMYCKAVNGELAWEIAEEFAREYISLPFDEEKAPHVVSVAQV
ncbi:hypothetical protein RJ641_003076 [Dillenia turbinata]|uniref:Uncharacterized protein n=1 Tax=Dillenia turbinata TaxID=194707 RepID=A0AAN8VAD7_9MAGN